MDAADELPAPRGLERGRHRCAAGRDRPVGHLDQVSAGRVRIAARPHEPDVVRELRVGLVEVPCHLAAECDRRSGSGSQATPLANVSQVAGGPVSSSFTANVTALRRRDVPRPVGRLVLDRVRTTRLSNGTGAVYAVHSPPFTRYSVLSTPEQPRSVRRQRLASPSSGTCSADRATARPRSGARPSAAPSSPVQSSVELELDLDQLRLAFRGELVAAAAEAPPGHVERAVGAEPARDDEAVVRRPEVVGRHPVVDAQHVVGVLPQADLLPEPAISMLTGISTSSPRCSRRCSRRTTSESFPPCAAPRRIQKACKPLDSAGA